MNAAPGWYIDPERPGQERYWNGSRWQAQRRPRSKDAKSYPEAETVVATNQSGACPYCKSNIHEEASRCPHCSGELRYCPSCMQLVGLTSKQKFVGLMRGGTKTQYRCMQCERVLDGPRW